MLAPFISYNLKNLALIEESEGLIGDEESSGGPSFWSCFRYYRFTMALLITFIYNVSFTQYLPTLSMHYLAMGCSQIFIGVSFALPIIVYVIMVLNMHRITSRIPKLYSLFIGLALLSVAFALIGPAPILPIEPAPYITTIGLVVQGFAAAFVCIPNVPEAIEAVEDKFDPKVHHKLHNYISGV